MRKLVWAWTVGVTLLLLGRPAPAAAQEWHPTVLHVSLGALMVAHGADVSTSMFVFGRDPDNYYEANPILRPFTEKPIAFGAVKMGLAVAATYSLLKLHPKHPRMALVVSVVQTVAVVYVAHRNAQQLK